MKIVHIKKNAINNILGWLVPTIVFIILTPIMVKKLGTDGFGVIALIQIVTGYMSILNIGFSEAIIKQVAEHVHHNQDRAMKVLWAGMLLFSAIGLVGAVILFFAANWIGMDILQVPENLRGDTVVAIQISALVFLLQMIAEFYRGSAIGCSRFDIPNISRIVRITTSGFLIYYVLETGGGLIGVMEATLAGLIIGLALNAIWMQRALPMYWVDWHNGNIFWELFHFSKHIFVARIAGMISGKFSQFLLGTLSSTANVALYEVPTRAAETGSVMLNRILQVFYPSFSSMDKVGDKQKIYNIMISVLSIQLLIATPLMLMIILEGPTLLAVWINAEFAQHSAHIITLVAFSYFLSTFTNLPTFAVMSFNYPRIISKYSILQVLITLIVAYPLVRFYGLSGAAWALFFSSLPGVPFVYECIKRIFGLNPFSIFFRPLLIHATVGISLYIFYVVFYEHSAWYSPFGVLIIGIIHISCAIYFKATSGQDNRRLLRLLTVWR